DYGDHNSDLPMPAPDRPWTCRRDPFSTYRAGFEVRTYRLCRRVLMFHHFESEPGVGSDCLVRSTDLTYLDDTMTSRLGSVTHSGYRRRGEGRYGSSAHPTLEFDYSAGTVGEEIRDLDLMTVGLDPATFDVTPHVHGSGGLRWIDPGAGRYGTALAAPMTALAAHSAYSALHRYSVVPAMSVLAGASGHGTPQDVGVHEWRALSGYDEERGPIRATTGDDTMLLADMTGDGLPDLVRVTHAEICYWPGLGHGRFGPKVTMDAAPFLGNLNQFDARRVRLADLDGSGAADLVYFGPDGARVYTNRGGNWWSPLRLISAFPVVDSVSSGQLVDLFGTGAHCLVWSSPTRPGQPVKYLDPTDGIRAHLLIGIRDHAGVRTSVEYVAASKFLRLDRTAGRTRMLTPVVVGVETTDLIGGTRRAGRYVYGHGHVDTSASRLCSFGRVDHTETADDGTPVLTRTWMHTGVEDIERSFAREYCGNVEDPARRALLADSTLAVTEVPGADHVGGRWSPSDAEIDDVRRTLRGSALRVEVYALDDTEAADLPFLIREHAYTASLLQPRVAGTRYTACAVRERETVECHVERVLSDPHDRRHVDPRVSHDVVIDVDAAGNVSRRVRIFYGRGVDDVRLSPTQRAIQRGTVMIVDEARFTDPVQRPRAYRGALPAECSTFELLTVTPTRAARAIPLYTVDEVRTILAHASESDRRLLSRTQVRYRSDDLARILALGVVETRALPGQVLRLAFTDSHLHAVSQRRGQSLLPADVTELLEREGGYIHEDGAWWTPEATVGFHAHAVTPRVELSYARENFFLPQRQSDAFGNVTTVSHDSNRLLLVTRSDALGNAVGADNDYRILAPWRITDPNGNRTEFTYDRLGRVAAVAQRGKDGDADGDNLGVLRTDPELADPEPEALQEISADPVANAARLLGSAGQRWIYDLGRFARSGQPRLVVRLERETHGDESDDTRIGIEVMHLDGLGRVLNVRKFIDAEQRWLCTGHTVFDGRGLATRTYEPYFSDTHLLVTGADVVADGVRVFGHDALGRQVATVRTDRRYDKRVIEPWRRVSWDRNDTAGLQPQADPDVGHVFGAHLDDLPRPEELAVYRKFTDRRLTAHVDTPVIEYLDPAGRVFLTVTNNNPDWPISMT
ncbi:MAG: hypothetical protein H0T78_09715, partial [Longispora sp.]|nr:hypothetical protein [Longispora sp. (in: high G+C Gram-positive bacteria)]